jgi:glycosyltransferase involved in cell wall biosynthesis
LEQILYAAEQVLRRTGDFRVDFVGTDRAEGFYHDLISNLGLETVVTVRKSVPYQEVAELIAGCDVALAYVPDRPAHWLYHPTLKVLEYRAVGVPILASDNAPNRDLVQDGENGLLVQNTSESLAEGISRFVLDRGFLERCRVNAQEMRQGDTWDDVARMYEQEVYLMLDNQASDLAKADQSLREQNGH